MGRRTYRTVGAVAVVLVLIAALFAGVLDVPTPSSPGSSHLSPTEVATTTVAPTHPSPAAPTAPRPATAVDGGPCASVRPSELLPTRATDRAAELACAARVAAANVVAAAGSPGWESTITTPPGFELDNLALTYDSADGYLLLFGATGAGPLDGTQTWAYAGGTWTQLHPTRSPESCLSSMLAYDPTDHYVVYFGGGGWGGGNCTSTDQTWSFSGGQWSQLTPTTSPSARDGASFTNDSADGYLLLFGGLLDTMTLPQPTNQTWKFVGGHWTALSPTTTPSPRSSAGMTYDAADGYVLLFGGATGSNFAYSTLNDTWTYSGGAWTQLHPSSHPIAPWPDGLAYDAYDRQVVYTSAENLSNPGGTPEQVWTFQAGVWTVWQANVGNDGVVPHERLAEATAYDWTDRYFVLYGGYTYNWGSLTDLWSFWGGNWTNLTQAVLGPSAREAPATTYDAADGYLLLFGGSNVSGVLSDTWEWSQSAWSPVVTNRTPPGRTGEGLVYDASDGYALMFGGYGASGLLADTWEYTDGGWTEITPSLSPPAAWATGMTYDAADGYVLLVDGHGTGYASSWSYRAGVWTNLTAISGAGSPDPANGVVYDSTLGRVVLFGTYTSAGTVDNTTWTFLNGTWTNLTSTVGPAPSPRDSGAMTFDPNLGYVLLFGGETYDGSATYNDTWTFAANHWTRQFTPTSPTGRSYAALTYNPPSETDLLFGGQAEYSNPPQPQCTTDGYLCGDTWQWTANGTVGPYVEAFTATPGTVDVGTPTVLSVTVYGGTTPYTYNYTGLPTGCTSANASTLACTPTAAGNFPLSVNVTDSVGNHSSATTDLTVVSDLAIASFNATPSTLAVGTRTLLSVVPANGVGPVGYVYVGLPPGCTSQTVPTLPCTPTASGTFALEVTATDGDGPSASAFLNLTVDPAGTVLGPQISSYGVVPSALVLGNSTTLYLNATGGTGYLAYTYAGLPAGCTTVNASHLSCTPTTAGVFPLTFSVVDAAATTVQVEANLTVYPVGGGGSALISAFGAFPGTLVVGNATVISVDATGGTPPLTYTYPSLPPGCLSADTASLPCTPTEAGAFPISVVVTDARGNATTARATLTVESGHAVTQPPSTAGAAVLPIGLLEWAFGGILGLLAAAAVTGQVLTRRRLHQEGVALVEALNAEAAAGSEPPVPPR
jgi:hypothetical protein